MTRSLNNWTAPVGNINCLNTDYIFDSDNKYGIPVIKKNIFVPKDLVPYGTEVRRGYAQVLDKTVHFFLDDYKFESLWNKREKTLPPILKVGEALTPDFSLYADYPLALQIYNTYRNRWLGCYWQELGVKVIPTITWSDKTSYDFCFLGVEEGSYVAISTVGVRSAEARKLFDEGVAEMCKIIKPSAIILYGEYFPKNVDNLVDNVYKYESFWKKRRRNINNGRERKS